MMMIGTEWTPTERLYMIQAIAARVESIAKMDAMMYRHEIASGAFYIRCVATQPAHAIEANRESVMAMAGLDENGYPVTAKEIA